MKLSVAHKLWLPLILSLLCLAGLAIYSSPEFDSLNRFSGQFAGKGADKSNT
ncbi:hypothetical protein [Paraburkholderia sp. RL17-337-BIB-A]|uniref:hypothetical protein n=1 Tax=Paraburkholderia sp. RL17-337-BIB-A TaxID=3031636 RepID=UPI0038B8EF60